MLSLLPLILIVSMFLFTGLTGKRALKESRYAFSASIVSMLEEEFLAPQILRLLREGDLHALLRLYVEKGIIEGGRLLSFEVLRESELKISGEYREKYDRLLPYLPDDLREFFGSLRIIRDVRNLEVLLSYMAGDVPDEEFPKLLEVGGMMETSLLLRMGESKDLESFLDELSRHLPTDFHITRDGELDFSTMVRRLNLDAVAFLGSKAEQIRSPEVDEVFSNLAFTYDMKNVSMIARLKSEVAPPEEIMRWLIPYGNTISQGTLAQLANTEDYTEFLNLLLETQFGKIVMRNLKATPNPNELWEASLSSEYSTLSSSSEGNDARQVWRYFFILEHEERIIRKGLRAIKPLTRVSLQ